MVTILAGITALLLAAWLIALAMRAASAALRHMVWTCAIGATLLFAPIHRLAPQRTISRPLPVVIEPARVVVNTAPVRTVGRQLGFSEIALAIWGLGATLFAMRFAASAWQFRRLMNDATPSDKPFPVPVLMSRGVPGPLVTGIFRPRIVLPENSAEWSPARYRAVIAHELAHIRRRDPAILFFAQLATVVYWFHPLCWFAAARLRMESERACDDAALRIGLRPSGYAGELLDLARLFNPQPAIPMATTSHLESRVKSILDPLVDRSFATRRAWLAAAVITVALSAPLTVFTLLAQAPPAGTGTITGTVTDPTGAVVQNVHVTASNSAGGNRETATSDAIGNFTFSDIPSGVYTIETRLGGFTDFHQNVTLATGGTLNTPVRLQVGGVITITKVVAPGSAKPTAPALAPTGGPIRVGGMVQNTHLLFKTDPVYPAALQAAGIEGTVLIEAVISKEGLPLALKLKNTSDPGFVSAAMDSARQWRWSPTMLNGEPVEALTTMEIDFKLQANGTTAAK